MYSIDQPSVIVPDCHQFPGHSSLSSESSEESLSGAPLAGEGGKIENGCLQLKTKVFRPRTLPQDYRFSLRSHDLVVRSSDLNRSDFS